MKAEQLQLTYNRKLYRYGYQGQCSERDEETRWNHFELREYDPVIGRWTSVDPVRQYFSPFIGNGNNPIRNIDPTGGENPIYSSIGEFRGVDEFGLQGPAIIYDGEFTNGMSQSEILGKGGVWFDLYPFNYDNWAVTGKINSHLRGLEKRPDWDGQLTFIEVTIWSNQGTGEPLFVNAGKIDLSPITVEDVVAAQNNNKGYIDFFGDGLGDLNTGRVFGTIKVTLLDPNTGRVKLGGAKNLLDIHDFKNPVFKVINDALYPGEPRNFNIYCAPCTTTVPTK